MYDIMVSLIICLKKVIYKMKKTLTLAILAGICIGLGGTVYLSVDNPVVGAALFSLGLLTILGYGFNLFTGKVGYILDNNPSYLSSLMLIWLGNLIGTSLIAVFLSFTRVYEKLYAKVEPIVNTKLDDNIISVLLLAIGCGICMFIAVDQYKKRSSTIRALFVIFPVMVFILCSFEHCVANMFYFVLAGSFTLKTLIYLLVMTVGNTIGGLLIPVGKRIAGPDKE